MKALRDYLKRAGITQTAFARELGVSQVSVSHWLNGVNSASASQLKKISQRTGLTVDELLADEPSTTASAVSVGNHVV